MIVRSAIAQRPLQVHLCNAFTLSLLDGDERLRSALAQSDLNLADGAPVAWLLRPHGLLGPVRGPSLIRTVVRDGAPHQIRHFLWGGAEGVAEQATYSITAQQPEALIAGAVSPPYREPSEADLQALALEVARSEAGVLWIGLGTPRQDYVVPEIARLVSCPVVPVGAAFDFLAGRVPEAPRALQGSGFEWVYRFSREPRRLWARYLLGNPRFLISAFRHRQAG